MNFLWNFNVGLCYIVGDECGFWEIVVWWVLLVGGIGVLCCWFCDVLELFVELVVGMLFYGLGFVLWCDVVWICGWCVFFCLFCCWYGFDVWRFWFVLLCVFVVVGLLWWGNFSDEWFDLVWCLCWVFCVDICFCLFVWLGLRRELWFYLLCWLVLLCWVCWVILLLCWFGLSGFEGGCDGIVGLGFDFCFCCVGCGVG